MGNTNGTRQNLIHNRKLFSIGEELIEHGAIQKLSADNDGSDVLGVANVVERVGVEQSQVGVFACGDRSLRIEMAEEFRRIARRRLQCFHWRQASLHKKSKFFVQAETRKHVRRGGVRSGHKTYSRLSHLPDDRKRTFHNLLAQREISFRAVFQTLVDSLTPKSALVPRNVLHAKIARQIRSGCHESEMHENGKRWNLPGTVRSESFKKTRCFFRRIRIEKRSLPRARAGKRVLGSFARRTGSELLRTQSVFFGRTCKENTGKMFDARLTGVRRFEGRDAVRDMADKTKSLLFTFYRDGKVCVTFKAGIPFRVI